MTVYISNLVAGLDKGLDHTELLLEMTRPFGGRVGIEFFIHTYSEAYMERMERIGEWAGKLPLALHGPFLHVEATSAPGTAEYGVLTASYGRAFALAQRFGCGHMVFHDHERFVRPEQKMDLQARCLENIGELIRLANPGACACCWRTWRFRSRGLRCLTRRSTSGCSTGFPTRTV